MKRFLTIIFILSIIPCVCIGQTTDYEKYELACKYDDAKEYDKALPIFNELAKKNHVKSLFKLGFYYNNGIGVAVNIQKAIEYYKKSAELGHRGAQYNLGWCYFHDESTPSNKEKSYTWFEKAFKQYKELAEKGDADAQLIIGRLYYYGYLRSGVDYKKALPWFEKAAAQGDDEAMNFLGVMYLNGYGVEKDLDKAYNYYLKAAEKGNIYAQRNLGNLFRDEDFQEIHAHYGTEDNLYDYEFDKEAEKWLRKAAFNEEANVDDMYNLAWFYLISSWDKDIYDAFPNIDPKKYLRKAAELGSFEAKACLGELEMFEKHYDKAQELLNSAKNNGITTFDPFRCADETDVDVCLMILQYLKKNHELKLEYYEKLEDGNYVLTLSKGGGNNYHVQLTKTGVIVSKTP